MSFARVCDLKGVSYINNLIFSCPLCYSDVGACMIIAK